MEQFQFTGTTADLTLYEDVTLTVPNLSASKLTSALNANSQAITNINVDSQALLIGKY